MADSPIYTCPIHRLRLTRDGDEARCPECAEPYPIENDVWILDLVRRTDRAAFDEQVDRAPVQIGFSKAERHLEACGIEALDGATVLDIGCGLGDLTYGLAVSGRLRSCDIYAFDHSVASLRRAAELIRPEQENRAFFSAQDASALFFPDDAFNLIVGAAVLHHILDYGALLREVYRLLRPGGQAVFSEPFLQGYFWGCYLLKTAIRDLEIANLDAPEYGLAAFIVENIGCRTRNAGNPAVLDALTDKHFFTVDGALALAQGIGYRKASFVNYNEDCFYDDWMTHLLDVYRVTDTRLRARAVQLYADLREYAGPALPSLVSHFKLMVLTK